MFTFAGHKKTEALTHTAAWESPSQCWNKKSFNNSRETSLRVPRGLSYSTYAGTWSGFLSHTRGGPTLLRRKWGVHPLRIYRSTAANTLYLCHVVSFELHDVRPFRAIRRNLDPN
jgi:hypothetical protein